MTYNIYQLLWIFFIYSFIGWCGEVVLAAVNRHKFVNRGFVSCPLCPVYGAGAVAVSVFLPELEEQLFFLFLGGMIVTAFVEYLTGRLLELIFHKKWWDYSDQKFQLDGYVCLKNSVIWGICSVLVIRIFNPLLCRGLELLPMLLGEVLLWVLGVLLAIDFIGSGIAVLGLKKQGRISQITEGLHRTSKILENALTERIQRRMVKAFPNIESGGLSGSMEKGAAEKGVKAEEKARFAQGCGFFKLASLFILGAFLGDIVETIFCFLTTGKLMSRSSLVFGQFSIVWGLACALLTWMLYRYRDRSDRFIFVFGTVLGGAYEYICSVFTEIAFGTVFWDYSEIPFNLGGRINLLYCFFWGIAAVVWMKGVYPLLSRWIEKLPARAGNIGCTILVVLLAADMIVSALALARYSERQAGAPEQSAAGQMLDEYFPDEFIEKRYENLKLAD
ncbi:MAG TPA: putative ABC transporter permease [Candidatus Mediterraneibacter stercorigallinarum]|uniref:ABC transporter permease n=1 Tax=Candidatus Mediterraneibacter stercorigallinarum TaxID=2838686 RepID=A0A9D2IIY4_9FIRM|nr:putative ABC transporter permease [Candidatus Mediterraneibacter stercorigallinarum]